MFPHKLLFQNRLFQFYKDLNAIEFFIQWDLILGLETGIFQFNIFQEISTQKMCFSLWL